MAARITTDISQMTPLETANQLRDMAKNLWSVEYRIRVDEDAALLERAATLLEAHHMRRKRNQ